MQTLAHFCHLVGIDLKNARQDEESIEHRGNELSPLVLISIENVKSTRSMESAG